MQPALHTKNYALCTSVTLSYRLRQTYKKSVSKVPRFIIHRTAILYVKRREKTRGIYRFMMGKREEERPLDRPRHKWQDSIETRD